MRAIKAFATALVLFVALASGALADSTVNPNAPTQNSTLTSAVVRNNFAAAYNDLTNILGKYAGPSAPTSPTAMQDWVNTSGGSVYTFNFWNPTLGTWVQWAKLNVTTGAFSVTASSGSFAATPPLAVTFSGGMATYAINYDSNFQTNGSNQLALNNTNAGYVVANCTASTAEPVPCTWNSYANQAISNVAGQFPINVAGTWSSANFGTGLALQSGSVNLQPATTGALGGIKGDGVTLSISGAGTISVNLANSNTWTVAQQINLNGSPLPTPQTGTALQIGSANSANAIVELDAASGVPLLAGTRVDGTRASPSAISSGDQMTTINAYGYNGTNIVGSAARFVIFAAESWSSGHQGSQIRLSTTPIGSTTQTDALYIQASGGVAIGNNVDPGIGNLYVNGSQAIGGALAPDAPLTINANVAASAAPSSGTLIHGVGANSSPVIFSGFAYANSVAFQAQRADGTLSGLSPLVPGDVMLTLSANGWDGLAYANPVAIRMLASDSYTTSSYGAYIQFNTTPAGTTSTSEAMRVQAGLMVGTTSDPGAGWAVVNTGIFAPLVAGGATASATLTLESTTVAGTSDAIILKTGSQVERARITTGGLVNIGPAITPDTLLTVNGNTGAAPVVPSTGAGIHVLGANSGNGLITVDTYGGFTQFAGRRADGTQASPTVTTAGDVMVSFAANGYNGTTYTSAASMQIVASDTFSGTDQGTYVKWNTTPAGQASISEAMRVQAGLMVGTTTDLGAGWVNTNTGVQVPLIAGGSAVSSALVLESTTGAGTSDSITLKTGSQVQAMKIATDGSTVIGTGTPVSGTLGLDINSTTATPSSAGLSTGVLRIIKDGTQPSVYLYEYIDGGSQGGVFRALIANGSASAPTAVPGGYQLFNLSTESYTGSAYSNVNGRISIFTLNAQTTSDNSTYITFNTTPSASTTVTEAMRINASGGVGIGTTTDPGTGGLIVNSSTASSSTTTGALVVTGGVGVGGGIVASTISTNNAVAFGGPIGTPAQVTKTASYSQASNDADIIFNCTASCTLTLLTASSVTGREIYVKTYAAFTVVSASSNVIQITGGSATTAILPATAGAWARLKSNGTSWEIMANGT